MFLRMRLSVLAGPGRDSKVTSRGQVRCIGRLIGKSACPVACKSITDVRDRTASAHATTGTAGLLALTGLATTTADRLVCSTIGNRSHVGDILKCSNGDRLADSISITTPHLAGTMTSAYF